MRFIKPSAVLAVLCLLIIMSCNSNKTKAEPDQLALSSVVSNAPITLAETANQLYTADTTTFSEEPDDGNNKKQKFQQLPKTDWDKKIIKTAALNIEVKDYDKFSSTVRDITKRSGGYIAREDQHQSEYKLENVITIKVPVDRFDEAINLLADANEKILERKIGSEDVTGEVVDTRSRMEAKKQVRERYLDLLKQAKNMNEILQVQTEINNIQVDIESAAGRVNYLTHSAALSTIELTYFQVINPSYIIKENPSFGTRMVESLYAGARWVGELLLLMLTFWPLFAVLGTVWFFIRKSRLVKNRAA
jgi:hypothetical protein